MSYEERRAREPLMRQRMLKPGFFEDEKLCSLVFGARLLFAGLWCMADRRGRLSDTPKLIKSKLFPYDDTVTSKVLGKWLDMLAELGMIQRYEAEGKRCVLVVNFEKHQNPHVKEPESTLPAPGRHRAGTGPAPGQHHSSRAESESFNAESESESDSDDAPVKPAPKSARKPSWVQEACADYAERLGGIPSFGEIGGALKPLVVAHPWEDVRPVWRWYLASQDGKYVSASGFAKKYGHWLDEMTRGSSGNGSGNTGMISTMEAHRRAMDAFVAEGEDDL